MQQNEEDETVVFSARICRDAFLEILGCGNRWQIVKLERVGRRIHWMVENFFGERPFLRFGLEINHRFFYNYFCILTKKRVEFL